LIDAIVKASEFNGGGETFQIASGKELTLNELVEQLKDIFKEETGRDMVIKYGTVRLGDVMRNFSDTSKAKNILNWQVSTELNVGLRKAINDLKNLRMDN
jgi:UDP-glucose 4-epimerase